MMQDTIFVSPPSDGWTLLPAHVRAELDDVTRKTAGELRSAIEPRDQLRGRAELVDAVKLCEIIDGTLK